MRARSAATAARARSSRSRSSRAACLSSRIAPCARRRSAKEADESPLRQGEGRRCRARSPHPVTTNSSPSLRPTATTLARPIAVAGDRLLSLLVRAREPEGEREREARERRQDHAVGGGLGVGEGQCRRARRRRGRGPEREATSQEQRQRPEESRGHDGEGRAVDPDHRLPENGEEDHEPHPPRGAGGTARASSLQRSSRPALASIATTMPPPT